MQKQSQLNSDNLVEKTDYIPYSELSEWLDTNLCLNELLYPTNNLGTFPAATPIYPTNSNSNSANLGGLLSPKFSSSVSTTSLYENESTNGNTTNNSDMMYAQDQKPSRTIVSYSTLCQTKPTAIIGCNTTIMFLTTADEMLNNKNGNNNDNNNNNTRQYDENKMSVSEGDGLIIGSGSERSERGLYKSQSQMRKSTASLSSVMSVSDQDQELDSDAIGENTDSFVESDSAMSEGAGNGSVENASTSNNHSDSDNNYGRRNKDSKNKIIGTVESNNSSEGEGGERNERGTGRRFSNNGSGSRAAKRGGERSSERNYADNEIDCELDSEGEELSVSKPDEGAEELDALKGFSTRRRRKRRASSIGGVGGLPHLSITSSQGAHLHFLSAYSCVSITNCSDCEIVIGAVRGAIIVQGCERIKLTVACRKLVVQNSLECELYVATLSPSVISGDSRSLSFGKILRYAAHN